MTQFTASEVRQLAVTMGAMNLPTTRDMLLAYADSLEADERAQPFMYTWSKEPDRDGVFRKIPLYTHSTQAQPQAASVTERDEDPEEHCESGDASCGPVEFHDSEGVPLCKACWDALVAENRADRENSND